MSVCAAQIVVEEHVPVDHVVEEGVRLRLLIPPGGDALHHRNPK
jgi:hypothetical protein